MSDINVFYTQQTRTTASPAQTGQVGNVPANGMNFFDLIFARLTALGENADQTLIQDAHVDASIKNKDEIVTHNDGQDLMALIASTIQMDGDAAIDPETLDLSGVAAPESAQITLDATGAKKLQAALQSLLQGIPAEQRPVVIPVPGQMKAMLAKLKIDAGDINPDSQNLIATGLSPEDMTRLMQMIGQGGGETIADESLQAVLVGIVKIVPRRRKDPKHLPAPRAGLQQNRRWKTSRHRTRPGGRDCRDPQPADRRRRPGPDNSTRITGTGR